MTRSSAPTWNRRAVVRRARMRAESRHRAARVGLSAVTVACADDRRVLQASSRDMDAERLGVTPLSSGPVVETRSSESPRARPPVVPHRVHTEPSRAITTASRWLRGRCRAPRAPTRHALHRTGCERRMVSRDTDDRPQITPRSGARQPRVHAVEPRRLARPGTARIAQEPDSAARSRRQCPQARPAWPGRSAAKSIDDGEHGTRLTGAMLERLFTRTELDRFLRATLSR